MSLFPMSANEIFKVSRYPQHVADSGLTVTNFTGQPKEFTIRGFLHELTDTSRGSTPFQARGAGGSERVFNLTCEVGTDLLKNDIIVSDGKKLRVLVQDIPREEVNPFTGCALSLVARCVEWRG